MRNIYASFNHILTITNESHPSPHTHLMSHIIVSYNEPLSFIIDGKLLERRGLIVNSGVEHTIECNDQKHILFLFDTGSYIDKIIKDKYLNGNNYYEIYDKIIYKIQEKNLFSNMYDIKNYKKSFDEFCKLLEIRNYKMKVSDKRIKNIIKWIKTQD